VTRCLPAYQQAKVWVKAGKIGEVKLIRSDFNYKAAYDLKAACSTPNWPAAAFSTWASTRWSSPPAS